MNMRSMSSFCLNMTFSGQVKNNQKSRICTNFLIYRGCLSTLTLLILTLSRMTLSRMTLSKVSFSYFLRNDWYLDHFDTFGENFDFDTFKNDTFQNDTFAKVYEQIDILNGPNHLVLSMLPNKSRQYCQDQQMIPANGQIFLGAE